MSRTTVVSHQDHASCVEHEHLPQSCFSGKRDDAIRTDIARELANRSRFRRRAGKPDEQGRVTFKQAPREFDITQGRPTPQRQQIAGVRD